VNVFCVAVCCSVLNCTAMCYSVLQCLAVSCSVLQCLEVYCTVLQRGAVRRSGFQCVAVCCNVLQCVLQKSICVGTNGGEMPKKHFEMLFVAVFV